MLFWKTKLKTSPSFIAHQIGFQLLNGQSLHSKPRLESMSEMAMFTPVTHSLGVSATQQNGESDGHEYQGEDD
jgi:hypothetical protein